MVVLVPLAEGQELRDEFTCPITRSLMRVPVIAADGHTYDRSAIERWLSSHDSSPRTGQALEHRMLVPNHNLKRLIDDLVREGGAGLYSAAGRGRDDGPHGAAKSDGPFIRSKSLVSEPMLLLQCLGPTESEWNGRSFEVSKDGAVGGRRAGPCAAPAPADVSGDRCDRRDFMPFADSTVSRRHFAIDYDSVAATFGIRDLGSASGTFRRLRPQTAQPLRLGDIAMIGKHQLLVKRASEEAKGEAELELECFAPDGSPLQGAVFIVGEAGAALGRRPTNAIKFSADVDGETVGVDASVSSEHARVRYDASKRRFELLDGAANGKASTNGTWLRLSALHAPSTNAETLASGDEILVGTIRFHVTVTHTVVERDDLDAKHDC
ncbi:hypothetical protein M885DRAFT_169201 [Pelagophyceae sp. CCMP2097]|nr:hypothetical protein M885DRAFT_169201 [Pelagophyceae sp. CCMP2097]|mmetsp:Transcript_17685/g.62880  ORF Transcript_17685/g.62880 Transcript_17685/m.62880 type:complete len:380 (-) Transcript_17685:28-1167(-)